MKAWRKHNMNCTRIVDECNKILITWPEDPKTLARRNSAVQMRLRNSTERRGQFAAEVSAPSQLLYAIFGHIGLPTPPEFQSFMRMSAEKINATKRAESTAKSA